MMKFDVTVSKSKNLDTASRPCYDGDDYTDQEYLKLGEIIKEKFQCSSPFIPKHLRHGLDICKDNSKAKKVMEFTRANMATMNPNMWRSDYYFIPPCTFFEFTLRETFEKGYSKIFKNIFRFIFFLEKKLNDI